MNVKYPNIKVKLTGRDGNAFAIMARVREEMRRANVPAEERQAFYNEATSGDYNNVLATCMRWVSVS